MILSDLSRIRFLSVWQAEMSLLTISMSSFLFRYPITCLSNDSFSSYGAFSPVEPFSGNKCLFHCVLLIFKPEMIMFVFFYIAQGRQFLLQIHLFVHPFQLL